MCVLVCEGWRLGCLLSLPAVRSFMAFGGNLLRVSFFRLDVSLSHCAPHDNSAFAAPCRVMRPACVPSFPSARVLFAAAILSVVDGGSLRLLSLLWVAFQKEAMKAVLLILVVAVAIASAAPFITQERVDRINAIPGLTWKASTQQGSHVSGASLENIKALLGVQRHIKKELPPRVFSAEEMAVPVPESFDSAAKWPECKTILQIRDQSACGSCWAIAAAEAMSDRYCIAGIDKDLEISTANLMECCWFCCKDGKGCKGGNPASAWNYWVQAGLFDEKCQPYPFPRCEHISTPSHPHYPPCPHSLYPTPACASSSCSNSTRKPIKHKGSKSYTVEGEAAYQRELMAHGPFEVGFDVYADWPAYKSGVYTQTSDEHLGGHAVKIVGWGSMNGVKYWKMLNSWNEDWGAEGYFLIRRGTDECGIESEGAAGIPLV